ncbi:MAG: hypothetical protein O3A93_04625 [Chloroflexi bacterium]|nr:hypothetical protein [Chloroflexota bacterium]MDA1270528.1 hypothetical protein [Chloroflexota bacterium]PKB59658.1 MAG: hypothetical protein BZY83_00540 [SAR202 cluster bacterium Casp-Chloro-G2]
MAQQTTLAPKTEEQTTDAAAVAVCRHHWVIQPADGPVSNGSCQVCGETREFKNYVESATWGDSRASKASGASATAESTSDDDEIAGNDGEDDGAAPGDDDAGMESVA